MPKREQKAVAGIGLVAIIADVGGLLLLIFGIDRHFHYSPLSSECGTTLGQLGQGASQALQTECSHASTWSVLGFVLAVIGAVVLVWGLKLSGSALVALAGSDHRSESSVRAPIRPEPPEETDWDLVLNDIGVERVKDLPPAIRRKAQTPLKALGSAVADGELIERVAFSVLRGVPGLLVMTDERILFLDGQSGLLELEFELDESTGELSEGVLTVKDGEGMAEFTGFEPNSLPMGPTRAVSHYSEDIASTRADARICDGCGAEYSASVASYTCPGCGGILYGVQ